jgi:hypothetical protein
MEKYTYTYVGNILTVRCDSTLIYKGHIEDMDSLDDKLLEYKEQGIQLSRASFLNTNTQH